MQGLGNLPVELLIIIIDQISRKDILKLRLCAPRNVLPLIDTIVFREICLSIDTSDDLERWKGEDEKEGVASCRRFAKQNCQTCARPSPPDRKTI